MTYDFAHWKPVTPAQYVEILAEIAQDGYMNGDLKSEIQPIDGSRYRIVFFAQVKSSPESSRLEPYLAMLVGEEEKTLCFERTDVYLA